MTRRPSRVSIADKYLSWWVTPADDVAGDSQSAELLAENQEAREAEADERIYARMRAEDDAGERGRL